MSRMAKIQQMLQNDPNDVFLNFSLAMEYVKEQRPDDAVSQFARVIDLDPDHVAAYYQQANLLLGLNRKLEATNVLERGMAAARRTNDAHMVDKIGQMQDLLRHAT